MPREPHSSSELPTLLLVMFLDGRRVSDHALFTQPLIPMRVLSVLTLAALVTAPLAAQAPKLSAAPSTRATTSMSLSLPRAEGQPAPTELTVRIDYGQPHVRGRAVPTELATEGTVWRTGANIATSLATEVDLTIGGAAVPKGSYSLYTIRTGGTYFLIINKNIGQSGAEYAAEKDLVRVPLTARTLHETQESLQIALVPPMEGPAAGALTIAWGTLHLSTTWAVR